MYPKDVRLFSQGSEWFAVYLEGTNENSSGERLVIKQYQVTSNVLQSSLNLLIR